MHHLRDMTILVTGVQGQVGFEVLRSIAGSGAQLVAGCRRPDAFRVLGYPSVEIDLAQPETLRAAIRKVKPNILINAAAYTAVDKAESESPLAFACNEFALQVMAEEMKHLKGAIIHFSTDYIYNPDHERPISEDDPMNPPNVYAASKLAGEAALIQSGVPYLCFRTCWVYGSNGQNFVKTMLKLGKDREALRIVGDQYGCPTSAETLGALIAHVLGHIKADPIGQIALLRGAYNISDEGCISWYEFAKEIFAVANRLGLELKVQQVDVIRTKDYPTPAQRPKNSRLALVKLAETFEFHPPAWQLSLRSFLYQSTLRLP